jgi:glycosyltransferase involved in cell wall biosynthesis
VINPLLGLEHSGHIHLRVALEWNAQESDLDWSDLVVFSRNRDPQQSRWLRYCLEHHIPVIYDLDDNFFSIPDGYDFSSNLEAAQLQTVTTYLKTASLVRVYATRMQQLAGQYNPSVALVTPPLDWSAIQNPPEKPAGPIKIIYATSRVSDPLAALFLPAIKEILKAYAHQVEMHFWGYTPDEMRGYPNVHFKPLTLNYRRYLRSLSRAGFEIGLAPLIDDEFHNSKTNTKYREYGAIRAAGIYSDTELYRACVQPGQTGLLVKNDPDEWQAALTTLIEDQLLRRKIQEQAYQYVRSRYTKEQFESIWLEQLSAVQRNFTESAQAADLFRSIEEKTTESANTAHSSTFNRGLALLRSGKLKFFIQRVWLKLEQLLLLIRIRIFKKL